MNASKLLIFFLAFVVCGAALSNTLSGVPAEAGVPNSLETIINDMKLPHEARPHGVPGAYRWSRGPTVHHLDQVAPATLDQFHALVAWGQAYVSAKGSVARNVRVEVRNIRAYVLTKSDMKWHLAQAYSAVKGAAWREDFLMGINRPIDIRKEPDGGVSARLIKGYNFHFFAPQRAPFDPKNTLGVFATFQARLIVDNSRRPDDRGKARILVGAGCDVWKSLGNKLGASRVEPAAGMGRLKFAGRRWRSFNMITLTEAQIRKYPPPIR